MPMNKRFKSFLWQTLFHTFIFLSIMLGSIAVGRNYYDFASTKDPRAELMLKQAFEQNGQSVIVNGCGMAAFFQFDKPRELEHPFRIIAQLKADKDFYLKRSVQVFAYCRPAHQDNWETAKLLYGYKWTYTGSSMDPETLADDFAKMLKVLNYVETGANSNKESIAFYHEIGQPLKGLSIYHANLMNRFWAVTDPRVYNEFYIFLCRNKMYEEGLEACEQLLYRRQYEYLPENQEKIIKMLQSQISKLKEMNVLQEKGLLLTQIDFSNSRPCVKDDEHQMLIHSRKPLEASLDQLKENQEYQVTIFLSANDYQGHYPDLTIQCGSYKHKLKVNSPKTVPFRFKTRFNESNKKLMIGVLNPLYKKLANGKTETNDLFVKYVYIEEVKAK